MQPAFTEAAAALSSSPAVTFVEVECRANSELCRVHEAGAGGWPTVKHFTAATGSSGARFVQKTPKKVCDELSAPGVLNNYVTETVAAAAMAAEL